MKKQLRNIIISLCVVLVLVVGVVVANIVVKKSSSSSSKSSTSSEAAIQVLNIKAADVTELDVKNNKDEYAIKYANKNYSIDGIEASLLSSDSCAAPIQAAAQLSATKLIEENASNLSQYGLDKPSRVVTVKTASKSETINVGSETPLKDGYYAALKGTSKVYKIESSAVTNFDKVKNDYVNLSLYSIDSESTAKVTKIAIGGAAKATPLVLEKDASAASSTASSNSTESAFKLKAPAAYSIDATKANGIITTLSSFSASGVISLDTKDASLEKYGLKTPQYTVTVTTNGKATTFNFGKPYTADGTSYIPVMLEGRKAIYKMSDTDDAFYKYDLKDICTTLLFTDYIETVDTITINDNGTNYTLKISGTGNGLTGTLNGKKISTENTRYLYQYIVGISFEGQADKNVTAGTPKMAVSVKHRDSKTKDTVMKFIPMDSRKSYWNFNGRTDFYVLNSGLDTISQALKDLAAGKNLKSPV